MTVGEVAARFAEAPDADDFATVLLLLAPGCGYEVRGRCWSARGDSGRVPLASERGRRKFDRVSCSSRGRFGDDRVRGHVERMEPRTRPAVVRT